MMERDRPTPDEILSLKNSIVSQFQQLPPEHQATLGLVLTKGILQGEMGAWFREALQLTDTAPSLALGFGLTEQERLFIRVSHQRFLTFLTATDTSIHDAQLSTNSYGEFLFVTMSRPGTEEREQYTFFGLGYHEPRDRWITDEWFWYQARPYSERQEQLEREQVLRLIAERQADISRDVALHKRSRRGVIFEELADMGDDDSVLADFEDGAFDDLE
ncbi:MAG: hypothetical protein KJ065_04400 [Anaerolineae bacterium]|nr:hypothetical protein [Anaerolineae bacterium]